MRDWLNDARAWVDLGAALSPAAQVLDRHAGFFLQAHPKDSAQVVVAGEESGSHEHRAAFTIAYYQVMSFATVFVLFCLSCCSRA